MNDVLVTTGCEGFIGSNFVRYMLDKYPTLKIYNIDKKTYAGLGRNLKDIDHTRYKLLQDDINNIDRIYLPKTEWIVNFSAETHVDRSIDNPFSFYRSNFLGVGVLLEYARKNNIKFLQQSSDEIYGDISEGASVETDNIKPSSPYSVSKAAADLLIQAYHRTYGVEYIITRSSNNFGPYQYPEKLIPLAITNLLQGKKVPIYGDGKQKRDWLYVLDNVKAIDFLLHKGKLNEIYNIGGFCNKEITNIDLVKSLIDFRTIRRWDGKIEKGREKFIKYVTDRLGHDRRYAICSNKLQELGFKLSDMQLDDVSDFDVKLGATYTWYFENQDWWKRLLKENSK